MSDVDKLVAALTQLTQAMSQQQPQTQQQNLPPIVPKISVQIPPFTGESKENVVAWLLQVQNVMVTQGITTETAQINYATTGFRDAALHWYLNKVVANNNTPPYTDWDAFATAVRTAFQPPNFQQYL